MTGRKKMMIGWSVLIASALLIFIVGFSLMESYALKQGNPDDGITLSRFIYDLSKAWPPIVFFFGWITGGLTCGLAVHFWWHWSPESQDRISQLETELAKYRGVRPAGDAKSLS